MQKVYTKIDSIVGNVVTVRAEGVKNGDLALVGDSYANVSNWIKTLCLSRYLRALRVSAQLTLSASSEDR